MSGNNAVFDPGSIFILFFFLITALWNSSKCNVIQQIKKIVALSEITKLNHEKRPRVCSFACILCRWCGLHFCFGRRCNIKGFSKWDAPHWHSHVWWLKDCQMNLCMFFFCLHKNLYPLMCKCLHTPAHHSQALNNAKTFTVSFNNSLTIRYSCVKVAHLICKKNLYSGPCLIRPQSMWKNLARLSRGGPN